MKTRPQRRGDIPVPQSTDKNELGNPRSVTGQGIEGDSGEDRGMMDGKPYPLPETWADSSIGKVVLKAKQRDPRKKPDEVFQYVDVSSVSNESFKITGATPTVGSNAPSRARKAIETDDVLFATVRPTLQRIALVPPELDGQIASTGYCVLRSDTKKIAPRFLYSFLITDHFNARMAGLERGASYPAVGDSDVMDSWLPLPPLPEQKKIAHILSTVQRAIEAQQRIIQTTTELKKALMHKLFTEGLRNEPQKQTEMGPVPENWEVVPLGELLTAAQYGMSVKGNPEGNYPILRMTNQVDGQIVGRRLQYVEISEVEFQKFKVEPGDILFNRTNSLDLVGRTAIFDIAGDFVFASYLIRLRTDEKKLSSFFLNCYFNTDEIQARLKSIATRSVSQSNISATRLKGFPVPKPSLGEQGAIVSQAAVLDRKLAIHRCKLEQLQDLFRTLLHELMTAKTRVAPIDIIPA
jgi:type I restriction enzyme, S subunit